MTNLRRSLTFILLVVVSLPAQRVTADDTIWEAEFELVGRDGEVVTHLDFRGRYVLLAFGFTNCPHVCPTMAANMAGALKIAENDASGIFISVDTERDSPQAVHRYATSFHHKMIGLSGNYLQINAAADNFNVTYVVSKSQKSYTVQHTSSIFVVDPEGRVVETFPLNARPGEMAAIEIIRGNPARAWKLAVAELEARAGLDLPNGLPYQLYRHINHYKVLAGDPAVTRLLEGLDAEARQAGDDVRLYIAANDLQL